MPESDQQAALEIYKEVVDASNIQSEEGIVRLTGTKFGVVKYPQGNRQIEVSLHDQMPDWMIESAGFDLAFTKEELKGRIITVIERDLTVTGPGHLTWLAMTEQALRAVEPQGLGRQKTFLQIETPNPEITDAVERTIRLAQIPAAIAYRFGSYKDFYNNLLDALGGNQPISGAIAHPNSLKDYVVFNGGIGLTSLPELVDKR